MDVDRLQVLDFDGDGDLDLLGANWSGPFQPVQVWENQFGRFHRR